MHVLLCSLRIVWKGMGLAGVRAGAEQPAAVAVAVAQTAVHKKVQRTRTYSIVLYAYAKDMYVYGYPSLVLIRSPLVLLA